MSWRDHFCIVFPLYNYNLYYSVKKLNGEGYSLQIIKKITTQILECLYFLQHPHLQIIHTDIKPDNVIFINNRSHDIKLIDFGSYLRYPPRVIYILNLASFLFGSDSLLPVSRSNFKPPIFLFCRYVEFGMFII